MMAPDDQIWASINKNQVQDNDIYAVNNAELAH